MMRLNRVAWLVGFAVFLAAASANAAGAPPRASHAIQPAQSDLIMARTGIGPSPHTGSRTVASFDYDQDGDLDLFVATQQGMVVWLNDGVGLFSPLSLTGADPPPDGPPASWVATIVDTCTPLDRTERASARAALAVPFYDDVRGSVTLASTAAPGPQRAPTTSPRAPPRR